ncbi:MAG TPA: DUF134 domain-containing protein [Thermodesulfovibrionia bacterium]|nr:DUF134 domain-containing protein [Thermodesulfovibrionia bacterium]
MSRPKKCRWITLEPGITIFKPRGIPSGQLEAVELQLDELEAIRLADLERLYQKEAAEKMEVSRATFGRIIEQARHKVADAMINGKMLVFKGGNIKVSKEKRLQCVNCGNQIRMTCGDGRPEACPSCGSENICCSETKD